MEQLATPAKATYNGSFPVAVAEVYAQVRARGLVKHKVGVQRSEKLFC